MAYDFEESSGQRITYTPNTDFTSKLSVSFWLKAESNPAGHQTHFVDKGKNNDGAKRNFSVGWTPGSGGVIIISFGDYAGTVGEWTSSFSPTTGTWQHWYVEIDWTTNPDTVNVWIDNVAKTMSNTFGSNNVTPNTSATQQISIGGEHGSADNVNNADGLLAEIGLWSDNNSALRKDALSKGYSPSHFTNNLTDYFDFVRNTYNLKGGTGTLSTSAPVVADHPLIIYPSKVWTIDNTASGATNVTVSAGVITMTSSLPAPTISTVQNVTVSAGVITATSSLPAPTIVAVQNVTVSGGVIVLTSSLPSPTISTVQNTTISASVITATLSVQSPTINTVQNVSTTAGVVTGTISLPAPTISTVQNVTVTPSAIVATVSAQTATANTISDATVSASVVVLSASLPSPTVKTDQVLSMSPVVSSLSLPTPSVSGNAVVSPSVLTTTLSIPSPTVTGTAVVTPDAIPLTVSIPTPTINSIENVSISISPLTAAVSLPSVTVSGGGAYQSNSSWGLDINSLGLIKTKSSKLPVWTTAGRPTGRSGITGWNKETNKMEVYDVDSASWYAIDATQL